MTALGSGHRCLHGLRWPISLAGLSLGSVGADGPAHVHAGTGSEGLGCKRPERGCLRHSWLGGQNR